MFVKENEHFKSIYKCIQIYETKERKNNDRKKILTINWWTKKYNSKKELTGYCSSLFRANMCPMTKIEGRKKSLQGNQQYKS